jgi:hypothetical protein
MSLRLKSIMRIEDIAKLQVNNLLRLLFRNKITQRMEEGEAGGDWK